MSRKTDPDSTSVDLGEDLLSDPTGKLASTGSPAGDLEDQLESARILVNEGLSEDAKRLLRRILIRDPNHVAARARLDEIHETELKQIFSDSAPALSRRPDAKLESEEALRRLERDLGLDRECAEIPPRGDRHSKDQGLSFLADPKAMERFGSELEKELAGSAPRDRIDLGIAFGEMGLHDLSARQFRSAMSDPGHRTEGAGLLAFALILGGKAYDAVSLLDPLLADTDIPAGEKKELMYLMGRAKEALGNRAEARWWYVKTGEIEGGYRDIDERIRALMR